MHEGQLIRTRSPEFAELFERIKVATRLSSKLDAYCLDDREAIRSAFEELIGKPVGDQFTLIPPFYSDYGLNISVGRGVSLVTNARSRAMRPSTDSCDRVEAPRPIKRFWLLFSEPLISWHNADKVRYVIIKRDPRIARPYGCNGPDYPSEDWRYEFLAASAQQARLTKRARNLVESQAPYLDSTG